MRCWGRRAAGTAAGPLGPLRAHAALKLVPGGAAGLRGARARPLAAAYLKEAVAAAARGPEAEASRGLWGEGEW